MDWPPPPFTAPPPPPPLPNPNGITCFAFEVDEVKSLKKLLVVDDVAVVEAAAAAFGERPIRLDFRSTTDTFCESFRHCCSQRKRKKEREGEGEKKERREIRNQQQ